MMHKYLVTVVRTGCMFVKAHNPEEAMEIADHQETRTVSWSDSWDVTDALEDPDAPDAQCITERAF